MHKSQYNYAKRVLRVVNTKMTTNMSVTFCSNKYEIF